ncbi:MAG: ABC transporter ATP-binding protein [Clostridiales bacterium]|jgi:NitT/TauT family transport system ATP-binding protein|nr:ABC transporter ATP-binding protein [Clostridiales bacterium]
MSIVLNNISKRFDSIEVLKNLNLTIPHGQITCILGSSGIGKTTLLNILLGLIRADSGDVEGLEGKKIVAVFQEDRLVENLSSIKNVQLACSKKTTRKDLIDDFARVGLEGFEDKPVSELSGGMKRRVAIIRAVFVDSDVIVMDEPFKGLDVKLKSKVIEYIRDKTRGKTVIIVTHSLEEVEELKANKVELNFTKNSHNVIMNKYQ